MRPIGFGALLHIAIGEGKLAVQHLEHVQAGRSTGRNGKRSGARGGDRRYPAREMVVVEQHPAVFEGPPSDALDLDPDRGPHRPACRRQGHRHVDGEGGLNEKALALLQHDIMQEAEILGHGESRGKPACRVAPDLGELESGGHIFAAVIFPLRHLPAALDGAPDKLKFRLARQPFRRDLHRRTRGAMLGRDRNMPDEAARRGERCFAAELRDCASRHQQ